MRHQSFCSNCGYHPAAAKRIEAEDEKGFGGPSTLGVLVVSVGMVLLAAALLLGRLYIWGSGDHRFWMRHLLAIGGATFAFGHFNAFGTAC